MTVPTQTIWTADRTTRQVECACCHELFYCSIESFTKCSECRRNGKAVNRNKRDENGRLVKGDGK